MTTLTEKMRDKIKSARLRTSNSKKAQKEVISYLEDNLDPVQNDSNLENRPQSNNAYHCFKRYEVKSVDDKIYLCSTCKISLLAGRIPAMAVANGLQLNIDPARPQLTELENNLIAHNINFQKMVLLQNSRWLAGKGRMICVPVKPGDIMNTVKQLPRLPSEAGLVPIKLKRKKQYKGHEKKEMIRPEKIFQALQYLRQHGHPFYQFYDSKESYLVRCKEKDARGYQLLMGEEDQDDIEDIHLGQMPVDKVLIEDEALKEVVDDDIDNELERDAQDIQDDTIRRHHFNYTEYSCLVNGHPEIFLDGEGNQVNNFTVCSLILLLV